MSIPTSFIYPEKPEPGDNIAILSPSSAIAGQIRIDGEQRRLFVTY